MHDSLGESPIRVEPWLCRRSHLLPQTALHLMCQWPNPASTLSVLPRPQNLW